MWVQGWWFVCGSFRSFIAICEIVLEQMGMFITKWKTAHRAWWQGPILPRRFNPGSKTMSSWGERCRLKKMVCISTLRILRPWMAQRLPVKTGKTSSPIPPISMRMVLVRKTQDIRRHNSAMSKLLKVLPGEKSSSLMGWHPSGVLSIAVG